MNPRANTADKNRAKAASTAVAKTAEQAKHQHNGTAEPATVRAAVLYASRDSAEPFVVEIDGTVFTRSRDPHEERRSGHKRPVCPVPRKCADARQCKEPCQPNSVFCPRHLAEARERVAQVKGGDRPKRWVAPVRTAGPKWS
jgi:hypothetical protein